MADDRDGCGDFRGDSAGQAAGDVRVEWAFWKQLLDGRAAGLATGLVWFAGLLPKTGLGALMAAAATGPALRPLVRGRRKSSTGRADCAGGRAGARRMNSLAADTGFAQAMGGDKGGGAE